MAAIVGVAIVFLDRVPTPRFSALRSPPVILPVLLLFMLAVGYLVRDRLIFTTYFQDFYPYVCVLGGIAASSLLERLAESDRVRLGLVGLFVVLLACGFSLFVATPLAPVAEDGDYERLSTVRGVMGVGDDIEARTTPRQEILTGQPLYVVDSDRELALDLSRRVYYVTDNESGPTKRREMIARIESVLKNREVPYVVVDGGTSHGLSTVLERSPRVVSALEAGYCPADDASLYDRYNATLYVRSSSAPAC
jgi:glutaredoxin